MMINKFLRILLNVVLAQLILAASVGVVTAQVNGSVDTTFGTRNNWAVFDTGSGDADVRGGVTDLLTLPDGRILAAGYCTNAGFGTGACLYRWTAIGDPDTTFGAGGAALVFADASIVSNQSPVRLVRRSNGAIFVASRCNNVSFGVGICVAAVNANGSGFDTSFGATGQTFLPLPSGATNIAPLSLALALQPDGKLLVGATCTNASADGFICVARLTTGAVFDTAFGAGNWSLTTPGPGDSLSKLVLLPDGRYFALATCGQTTATAFLCSGLFFPNGTFQRTLSTDVPGRYDVLLDARVHGDKLSLQWNATDFSSFFGGYRIYAARRDAYTAAGNYDTSFGGYPSTGVAGDFNLDTSNDGVPLVGIILRDGSFLYFGRCNSGSIYCSARFAPNGILDASYGVGGRFEYGAGVLLNPWNFGTGIRAAAETVDGKVVVAGYCNDGTADRPCVLRMNSGPDTAKNCTMDIDGDGFVNATTDGLILLRAMLGFSGTSALANAVAPGAARSTWPQVRDYLFDQCRMPVPVQ
jgi:uncharacterized delta-60 repeat protein